MTLHSFDERTIAAVMAAFSECWNGGGRLTGLKAPQYVFAMIVDLATSVDYHSLPADWHSECKKVLDKLYPDAEHYLKADQELFNGKIKVTNSGHVAETDWTKIDEANETEFLSEKKSQRKILQQVILRS